MTKEKDPFVTLKVRESTKAELIKVQGLYQVETGKKVALDAIIRTFIEAQPKVDLMAKLTTKKLFPK